MMNIRQRILAVMKELNGIELVKTAGLKFKIIQHDDVTEALRPLYLKHGIDQEVTVLESRQLDGGTTELLVGVSWVNVDEPTDRKSVVCVGHASSNYIKDGAMRRDDLGVGKALSYAVKMAQLKNFALLSGDGDLEREQAKPAQAASTTEQIETVMNALASARTKSEFNAAAEICGQLVGLTEQQKQTMSNAWLAAKQRVEENKPDAPLPPELENQSAYGKVTGEKHLDPRIMAELIIDYGKVRTRDEFAVMRQRVSKIHKEASKAQWALLAEKDQAAEALLKAQEAAAQ